MPCRRLRPDCATAAATKPLAPANAMEWNAARCARRLSSDVRNRETTMSISGNSASPERTAARPTNGQDPTPEGVVSRATAAPTAIWPNADMPQCTVDVRVRRRRMWTRPPRQLQQDGRRCRARSSIRNRSQSSSMPSPIRSTKPSCVFAFDPAIPPNGDTSAHPSRAWSDRWTQSSGRKGGRAGRSGPVSRSPFAVRPRTQGRFPDRNANRILLRRPTTWTRG